ncbi:MAG: helix-turn-helix transcriptional regulator [Phycicoccus sp.]|nr:helix-turn-helix transcriptional regulator [Phycicoccus sp.]
MFEGLPTAQERLAYGLLIDEGPLSMVRFATALGVDTEVAADLVASLHRQGLVTDNGKGEYTAAPPALMLGPAVERQQQEARALQLEIESLVSRYRSRAGGSGLGSEFDIIEGADNVRRHVRHIMASAQTTFLALALEIDIDELPEDGYPEQHSVAAAGLDHRVILDDQVLRRPALLDDLAVALKSGVRIGVRAGIPTRMMIIDSRVATMPLTSDVAASERLLFVYSSPMLRVLISHFEALWTQSSPIVLDALGAAQVSDELEPADAQILGFVLAGATDEAIARQLGLSLRTVQRRVHQLMVRWGAVTRVQLGFEAGRRGWSRR